MIGARFFLWALWGGEATSRSNLTDSRVSLEVSLEVQALGWTFLRLHTFGTNGRHEKREQSGRTTGLGLDLLATSHPSFTPKRRFGTNGRHGKREQSGLTTGLGLDISCDIVTRRFGYKQNERQAGTNVDLACDLVISGTNERTAGTKKETSIWL